MKREIWEILLAFEQGKLTIIQTHEKLCSLHDLMLHNCLSEQQEVISSPIRFNGVHVDKIKQVYKNNGFELEDEF